MNNYDIIIIGTGSGGSTMAYKLAPTGKKILILERGGFVPKEKENWDAKEVVANGRYRPKETWYDKDGEPFKPFIHYNVGGNSKFYGAAMFRFRESDFKEVKHYGGTSPAWPFGYETLDKYYDESEKLFSVHGLRGSDPTEPPTSMEYPYSHLPFEPLTLELSNQLKSIGLNPFPLPMAIKLPQDTNKNASPVLLENFDGFPDPTDSKADGQTSCLNKALAYPNVTLITNAFVNKILTNEDGDKATGVEVIIGDEEVVFNAGLVFTACGAINSAALFLRSANEKHPNGLANSSGLVGKNLMLHHNGCLVAFTKKNNDCKFQKSFGLADFYNGAADSEYPLGEIQLMGRNDPDTIIWMGSTLFPGKSYEELKASSIDFWLTAEDLPSTNNQVSLRGDGSIKVSYDRTNYTAYEKLKDKLKKTFVRLGEIDPDYKDVQWGGYDLDVSGVSHQNGTLKMGTDPTESVVNIHCQAHDISNLFVCDASFFPSCGAFNPALTLVANSLRVGDYVIEHFKL
jgi:choline dehydrogenase-like flavoprotein